MRLYLSILWISIFLISYFQHGQAQESMVVMSNRDVYELLLTRYGIYKEYYPADEITISLLVAAAEYAGKGDYDLARLYLEEVLAQIKSGQDSTRLFLLNSRRIYPDHVPEKTLELVVASGFDFNRQEFEIGYLENDSTVLEEINKPYFSVTTRYPLYRSTDKTLEISNSVRLDHSNLRDEYEIQWKTGTWFTAAWGGFWNQSDESEANSFWEHGLEIALRQVQNEDLLWQIRENYVYKSYKEKQIYLADFYRNRFNAALEWLLADPCILDIDFLQELNESLGSENMDYFQNGLLLGGHGNISQIMDYSVSLNGMQRQYSIHAEDSLIKNKYNEWNLDGSVDFRLSNKINIEMLDNFISKNYKQKSNLEPDYIWNYLRPSMNFTFSQYWDFGLGYEWEVKKHENGTDQDYDVTEQDYQANGLFLNLGIYGKNGLYFNGSASYQWRRYSNSVTNEILSIYSNRDVFSVFFTAFIPLSGHFSLNAFATYDNDKDIDLDQQNNQSVIFNMEVAYKF